MLAGSDPAASATVGRTGQTGVTRDDKFARQSSPSFSASRGQCATYYVTLRGQMHTNRATHTHVEHIVAIVGCGQIETVVNMLNLVHRGVLDRTWTTVGWMFSSLRDGKPGRTRTQTLCILVPFFFLLFRLRFAMFVARSPGFGQKLANACQQLLWRIY